MKKTNKLISILLVMAMLLSMAPLSLTASAADIEVYATYELPYEGAKEMLLVNDVDNRDYLSGLFKVIYDELPPPKKKKDAS